jgi:hypothetical protein
MSLCLTKTVFFPKLATIAALVAVLPAIPAQAFIGSVVANINDSGPGSRQGAAAFLTRAVSS